MQKMVAFFESAHHPSEIYGPKISEWSGGDPTTWAASVAAAIKVARSGKVIAAADRGGKDWHFWAACAATQRSIIGVYKTKNGNWSACGWRFTGGQATRLKGLLKKSNMLAGADVTRILSEDESPIVTTPGSNLPLLLGAFMTSIQQFTQHIPTPVNIRCHHNPSIYRCFGSIYDTSIARSR